jgi:hypothetical protein
LAQSTVARASLQRQLTTELRGIAIAVRANMVSSPVRRLLHRWFVEYNPLYLLSAALVVRGVNVISRELLGAGHVHAELGGPAIAELYAWTLIGGAAVLLRAGKRRPAVMLALIAVLYQGDLTLHSETCAYLGWVGWIASGVWLVSFVLKLVALARAMQLRVSRSAFLVPILGAAGLVVVPRLVQQTDAHVASIIVGGWSFALFAVGLSTSRRIESATRLDPRAQIVLRRSLLATWAIWALLASLHVVFWFSVRPMEPAALIPVPLLLLTRFVRRDVLVWAAVGGTLLLLARSSPALLWFGAALGAITFAAHASRTDRRRVAPFLVGLLSCAYLSAWTFRWSGGSPPTHVLWLDLVFFVVMAICVWRLRARAALGVLAVALAQWSVQIRVVTKPMTSLEWGMWSVALGFVLLVASIGTTVVISNGRRAPP